MKCRICNTEGDFPIFVTKEMMYGSREEFIYFQCSSCHCLQIEHIPNNLGEYYPEDYYSYNLVIKKIGYIKRIIQKQRARTIFFNKGFKISRILNKFFKLPYEELEKCAPIIKETNIDSFFCPILDVGCGANSWWLNSLNSLGFTNLVGIEPYIDKSNKKGNILTIKEEIIHHKGKYKLITFHHSFEHIAEQQLTLQAVKNLLTIDGVCVIRIPTVSSYVWEKYGINWVELDPPRHLFLHSLKSIETIAKNNGLSLFKTKFDSTEFEFIGSEQYQKGIPLRDKLSYFENPDSSLFSDSDISYFKSEAKNVNAQKKGGRAVLFFKLL